MPKFRKKPVVIEAWENDGNPASQMVKPKWLSDAIVSGVVWLVNAPPAIYMIKTLEGEMVCSPGDWIIQGVKGELYPCKPDIFKATYEAA